MAAARKHYVIDQSLTAPETEVLGPVAITWGPVSELGAWAAAADPSDLLTWDIQVGSPSFEIHEFPEMPPGRSVPVLPGAGGLDWQVGPESNNPTSLLPAANPPFGVPGLGGLTAAQAADAANAKLMSTNGQTDLGRLVMTRSTGDERDLWYWTSGAWPTAFDARLGAADPGGLSASSPQPIAFPHAPFGPNAAPPSSFFRRYRVSRRLPSGRAFTDVGFLYLVAGPPLTQIWYVDANEVSSAMLLEMPHGSVLRFQTTNDVPSSSDLRVRGRRR